MPQAEFDLLNAQLGLSFDPFLSFDFGTTSTSTSTSNYPLVASGSAGGNFGMTTGFNEQEFAFQPQQLQQQAIPGPSNYYQYQAQSQEQSRTGPADEPASRSKSWHTGRTDNAAPLANHVDLDDDEASSEDLDDEDATHDPFDDPIYLRYVTLEQAERLFGT
jgi:hypothetical protein